MQCSLKHQFLQCMHFLLVHDCLKVWMLKYHPGFLLLGIQVVVQVCRGGAFWYADRIFRIQHLQVISFLSVLQQTVWNHQHLLKNHFLNVTELKTLPVYSSKMLQRLVQSHSQGLPIQNSSTHPQEIFSLPTITLVHYYESKHRHHGNTLQASRKYQTFSFCRLFLSPLYER